MDEMGQLVTNNEDLPANQAHLFAHSDPVNPIPKHPAFTKMSRLLKQRSINPTNLSSDFLGFVSANPIDWDIKLDGFLYTLRTCLPVCNKGYSAFHLMMGRNPNPLTGKELMVRSLIGAKQVLTFFTASDERTRAKHEGILEGSDEESLKYSDNACKKLKQPKIKKTEYIEKKAETLNSTRKQYQLRSRSENSKESSGDSVLKFAVGDGDDNLVVAVEQNGKEIKKTGKLKPSTANK